MELLANAKHRHSTVPNVFVFQMHLFHLSHSLMDYKLTVLADSEHFVTRPTKNCTAEYATIFKTVLYWHNVTFILERRF